MEIEPLGKLSLEFQPAFGNYALKLNDFWLGYLYIDADAQLDVEAIIERLQGMQI